MTKKTILLIYFLTVSSMIHLIATENYEKNSRIALLTSLFSTSGTLMLSSFITGNIALNNLNNELFNGIMGITSIGSLCLASLCTTIPSVYLIYYLYDYIINNPEKYINNHYFKVRNALIITLCGNSLLWNTSSIMTFFFIFNYSNKFGNQDFNHVMASNFGYISIYTIINSIVLSAAIIMKHCLYKAYYSGKLKKSSISMVPYFDADVSKKIDLGLILKI